MWTFYVSLTAWQSAHNHLPRGCPRDLRGRLVVAEIAAFRIDDRFVPAPEALFMDSPRSFFCGVLLRFAHLLDVFFTMLIFAGAFLRTSSFYGKSLLYHLPGFYLYFVHRLTERLSISNLQIKYPSCFPNGRVFYYSPFWSNRSSVSLFYTHYIVEPGSMQ